MQISVSNLKHFYLSGRKCVQNFGDYKETHEKRLKKKTKSALRESGGKGNKTHRHESGNKENREKMSEEIQKHRAGEREGDVDYNKD